MGKTRKTKHRSKGNVKKPGNALSIFEKRMEFDSFVGCLNDMKVNFLDR